MPISALNSSSYACPVRLMSSRISLNRFGGFLTWTISSPDLNEIELDMSLVENSLISSDGKIESSKQRLGKKIILRNILLEIFLTLVDAGGKGPCNERFVLATG